MMGKALLFILIATFATIVQLSYAEVQNDSFNDEFDSLLGVEEDNEHPEPSLNRICRCESSSCSCCVKEFKKRICVSLDFIEKIDEATVFLRANLSINDRQVLSETFSSNSIPPICYANGPLGVCVKLNARKEDKINVCATLQVRFIGRVKKEHDLFCLVVPNSSGQLKELSQARVPSDYFNDELSTELEVENDDDQPEPTPNKACHCENSSCSCCVTEFKKRICTSLDFIEKVDEDTLLIRVNLTINCKQVLSQKISTDVIPALCYQGITGFGACVKLNTRVEEVQYKLCTSLQIIYGKKLVKEYDLHCMSVPRRPNNNEDDINILH